jgi:DTW domain-containing protein YfiP
LVAPPTLQPQALTNLTRLRVIVLDGTWRKSRKMLYLNPSLQKLPRLGLQTTPSSQYRIRKAHRDDQLSTLEATCHALMQLGEPAVGLQRLLDGFDGFVAQHAATQSDRSERARPDRSR